MQNRNDSSAKQLPQSELLLPPARRFTLIAPSIIFSVHCSGPERKQTTEMTPRPTGSVLQLAQSGSVTSGQTSNPNGAIKKACIVALARRFTLSQNGYGESLVCRWHRNLFRFTFRMRLAGHFAASHIQQLESNHRDMRDKAQGFAAQMSAGNIYPGIASRIRAGESHAHTER